MATSLRNGFPGTAAATPAAQHQWMVLSKREGGCQYNRLDNHSYDCAS